MGKVSAPRHPNGQLYFCVPFREDEFIDDEEDHHRHAAGEDSGEDIVQEIGDAQRARHADPNAVDGVDHQSDPHPARK